MAGLLISMPQQASVTGDENLQCDTNAAGIASAVLSSTQIAGSLKSNFKNLLDGGDFTINPWQRGTTSGDIANTLTYQADRFFAVGGASSAINISKQAITALPGFGSALRFQRKAANADTAVVKLGQVIENLDCFKLQGQTVVLSFWAMAGANFSAAQGLLGLQIYTGTGTNDTAANMLAGSWAGSSSRQLTTVAQNLTNIVSAGGNDVGVQQALVATNVTGVNVTTTWTRYQVVTTIPATATACGVVFSFTPVGTAGAADYAQLAGVQLEIASSYSPFATAFEFRDVQVELEICQRYFYAISEPASAVVVGAGMVAGTNAEIIFIPNPVQMFKAPTVTVSAGSFKFNVAGTPTAVAGFAAGTTHTVNAISVVGTTTATSGQATLLTGGGGAGYIYASADF